MLNFVQKKKKKNHKITKFLQNVSRTQFAFRLCCMRAHHDLTNTKTVWNIREIDSYVVLSHIQKFAFFKVFQSFWKSSKLSLVRKKKHTKKTQALSIITKWGYGHTNRLTIFWFWNLSVFRTLEADKKRKKKFWMATLFVLRFYGPVNPMTTFCLPKYYTYITSE